MEIFDIATMGTSLSAGTVSYSERNWQIDLERALTPGKSNRVRVHNLGVGGETSAGGLARVGQVIKYRPRLVTIEYMMNDCSTPQGISTAQSQANHQAIINAIRSALPDTLIYLMTMNPPIGAALTNRPNIESYNNVYRSMTDVDLPLIDIAPLWGVPTSGQIPDTLHPTSAQERAITVPAIAAAISPLIA